MPSRFATVTIEPALTGFVENAKSRITIVADEGDGVDDAVLVEADLAVGEPTSARFDELELLHAATVVMVNANEQDQYRASHASSSSERGEQTPSSRSEYSAPTRSADDKLGVGVALSPVLTGECLERRPLVSSGHRLR